MSDRRFNSYVVSREELENADGKWFLLNAWRIILFKIWKKFLTDSKYKEILFSTIYNNMCVWSSTSHKQYLFQLTLHLFSTVFSMAGSISSMKIHRYERKRQFWEDLEIVWFRFIWGFFLFENTLLVKRFSVHSGHNVKKLLINIF